MASRIPVVICVDVEPDGRDVDRHRPLGWRGFEELPAWFERLRARLAGTTRSPAHFSWFFRMDSQVSETYGSPGWAVARYRASVDALQARGDELGVHTHAYRWDDARAGWLVDDGSQTWVDHCVRMSLQAFEDALGRRCRAFRFGDGWMSDATVRLLEELGVSFDLTLEPGMPAMTADGGVSHTGSTPDLTGVPRAPYRPSRSDFRRPDPDRADGLWMLPVATGRLPTSLHRARAFYYRLTGRGPAPEVMALNGALRPPLFRGVVDDVLASPGPRCLVLQIRSDVGSTRQRLQRLERNMEYLLARPLAQRFVFCTPAEAVERLGLEG